MNTQKVAEEYRLSQWAQVIQAQQESGQSIKDFCEATPIGADNSEIRRGAVALQCSNGTENCNKILMNTMCL